MFHVPVVRLYGTADSRPYNWAEYSRRHEEGFDRSFIKKGGLDVFFFGAIQYDMYGNMNMFGVGDDYKHLKFRGPGIIGLAHVATHIKRFYIYATEHSRRRCRSW
jgi:glutaconate CoA-transferase subunit B